MLNVLGTPKRGCDGITRRDLLRVGSAGVCGLSLPTLLAAESALGAATKARAKSVMFVFLYGGPSQLETFDMKPDAPSTIRGPYKPIASRTPGLRICEHLPRLAACSDKYAVVRTLHHTENNHNGTHFIQTGTDLPPADRGSANVAATDKDWPAFGSVVSYLQAQQAGQASKVPAYIYLPRLLGHYAGYDINGQYAGWLGKAWDPVATAIRKLDASDNPYYRDCNDDQLDFRPGGLSALPTVTLDRLDRRQTLLQQLDLGRRQLADSTLGSEFSTRRAQAMDLLTSRDVAEAFDIRREPAALRDRYGRNLFGQSLLMGRRLIESGSRFVTVAWDMAVRGDDTTSWDSHRELTRVMRDHLLPGLDQGLPTLLEDMAQTGLLDETLVYVCGEIGRTPRFQNRGSADGRDHWSYCFPCLFAGAGVQGGITYGDSDAHAAYPADNPVAPGDLAATIYDSLGISPDLRIPDPQGRPVPLVAEGKPLRSLFG